MPKNAPAQSYGAVKLACFPGWPVTKISKSANMKNLDTIGKSTKNANKLIPKNKPVQSYEVLKLASFLEPDYFKVTKLLFAS